MKKLAAFLGLLAIAAGGMAGWWYFQGTYQPHYHFRLTPAERAPFLATIAATGTIQPEEVIDVGAQVAGRINNFGTDPRSETARNQLRLVEMLIRSAGISPVLLAELVPQKVIDYGTPVEQGTILVQLDPSLYQTRVERARADLERARADLHQLEAKLLQADGDWRRAQDLNLRKAISASEVDLARAGYDTALANLNVGRAVIAQANSALQETEINLGYTTIRSPVKGVIVDRRVNVGQTVVASLNAPSLFLIAKDLKKLEVWSSVNEADIGQVRPGQEVRFTVDAYPTEAFHGQVAEDQPRLNASMTQNVVTYTVVVNTDNFQGKLLPYLTANLQFVVEQKGSALLIPNSALRWRPQVNHVVPEHRAAFVKSLRQRKASSSIDRTDPAERTIWVPEKGLVRPVKVKIGLNDGSQTEVLSGEIQEGDIVVEGEDVRADTGDDNNPFMLRRTGK